MKVIVTLCCVAIAALAACSGANPQDVSNSPPVTNTLPNTPDAGVDASVTAPTCVSESNADFCARTESSCNVFDTADNCGVVRQIVNCGMCANQSACVNGKCSGCAPETDNAFCSRLGKACGGAVATDHCGATKTVLNCGSCKDSEFCNDGACTTVACVPESDATLCATLNETCGPTSAADNCGVVRGANCGTCGKGFNCTDHNCVACAAKTCSPTSCGLMNDGCHPAPLDCGGCVGTDTCVNNVCTTLYSQLCSAPVMPKVFLGSCTAWNYTIDAAACTSTLAGAAVEDYVDNYTAKPDTGHKAACLGATNGVQVYTCINGKLLTVTTATWSDTQVSHMPSVGGCQSEAATTNGANVLCSEYTHWYGSPDTTAAVKATCVAPYIYLANP